jgi:hypothetical protein
VGLAVTTPQKLLIAAVVLVVGAILGYVARGGGDDETQVGATTFDRPDDPPPEYLYLDTARVLAYLGQIEQGLTTSEKRSLSVTGTVSGKLAAGGNELGGSAERVGSVEQNVTAGATDRFYRLLGALAEGRKERRWLYTLAVDTAQTKKKPGPLYDALRQIDVGDFVRLRHAQVFLAPYATAYPKTAYARFYLGPDDDCRLPTPSSKLIAPSTVADRRALRQFRRKVGDNPRMTFIVPSRRASEPPVFFVVPVRYGGLTSEPSSLAGDVTIVGKVLAKEDAPPEKDANFCSRRDAWVDRQTVRTFSAPLRHADPAVPRLLKLQDRTSAQLAAAVRAGATFPKPAAVVLPVAIYQ